MDVTSIGDVNLDIVTSSIEDFPVRDAQEIVDMHFSSGGCAANFAKASAGLGVGTRLIGRLGDDVFGDFVMRDLCMKDLDLRISCGGRTGATVAVTFRDHTRSFLTYPGCNSELTLDDIDFSLIQGRYLHVASFFLQGLRGGTKKILDYAHGRGMVTCFDTGFDPGGWSGRDLSLVRRMLGGVDFFFPNWVEAKAISGCSVREDVCEALVGFGPELIALKLGSEGCFIYSGGEGVYVPPFRVGVVDSTGAGDVFGASFVFGHLRGWGLGKIGRFANAAAALSTRGFGSGCYPGLKEVLSVV
ncbi:MAG: carbohydrate kinase family protein [Candidatus Altiarchaeota archaeon]|nr:carbohydrate kinase family protein [Candidatus Altiarchaeota archaeon]